jgi:hypothetical protein
MIGFLNDYLFHGDHVPLRHPAHPVAETDLRAARPARSDGHGVRKGTDPKHALPVDKQGNYFYRSFTNY